MIGEPVHPAAETTLSRAELVRRLRSALPAVLQSRPVALAYLYGSMADGPTLPDSDIDIALVLTPGCGISAYDRMALELDVADELAAICDDREVDVRVIDDAPLAAQGIVLTEGTRLYARDEAMRIDFEERTRKLHFDFQPTIQMMRQAYFQHKSEALQRQRLVRDG